MCNTPEGARAGGDRVGGGREGDRRAILQQAHILETKKMLLFNDYFMSCGHAEPNMCRVCSHDSLSGIFVAGG